MNPLLSEGSNSSLEMEDANDHTYTQVKGNMAQQYTMWSKDWSLFFHYIPEVLLWGNGPTVQGYSCLATFEWIINPQGNFK